MKNLKNVLVVCLLMATSTMLAQTKLSGNVVDDANQPLPGATVVVVGTSKGATTDFDGNFTLSTSKTKGQIKVSYVGFKTKTLNFDGSKNFGTIALATSAESLEEVVITGRGVIDIAKDRETPVAVTTIKAEAIQAKLGNKEFPEIMNTTPSVYATKQSGGYGDSRINVRGFDQRNLAIIINGQPVNDMENGWVYWSNWAGLSDIASGIQIQRGLGASKLAVPSVGGTINVVTKTTDKDQGGFVGVGLGHDGYLKTTVAYNTGTNEDGWAASALLGRWQGDGYAHGLEGEGYNYLFSLGYNPSEAHNFNITFTGAGQWHNKRSMWLSIRDYQKFGGDDFRRFNGDLGYRKGELYTFRRNFYNKPIATLNWDWQMNDELSLSTSIYGSWGRGGGTGPRGAGYGIYPYKEDLTSAMSKNKLPHRKADGTIDIDNVIAKNKSGGAYTGGTARGAYKGKVIGSNGYKADGVNKRVSIRRASMNSHDWYGAISNLKYELDNWTFGAGIDLRTYTGYHYRVLNDLLGLDGYYSTGNKNLTQGLIITNTVDAAPFKDSGIKANKIDYYNVGDVKWAGFNGIVEYKSEDKLTAVLQGGISNQSYQRTDYFDQPNNVVSDKKSIAGGYVKGGANYNISESSNVFFNAGYIQRQPNFDAIFPNYKNIVNDKAENEVITSIELGYGYKSELLDANVNLYNTKWGNRFISRSVKLGGGVEGTANFSGINQLHQGVEVELTVKPLEGLRINGMTSIGNWRYTKDFVADVFDEDQKKIGSNTLYLKGVKIGDAAQFTTSINADYKFLDGFNVDATWRNASNLYADYSIEDSGFYKKDNKGALKLPSYNLFDLGLGYKFNVTGTSTVSIRANVNNLFDAEYISESKTNTHTDTDTPGTYKGIDTRNYVWFGFGRTWNVSLRYNF